MKIAVARRCSAYPVVGWIVINQCYFTQRFKYLERKALNKEGSDSVRLKYICSDSLQNKSRTTNGRKEEQTEDSIGVNRQGKRGPTARSIYDCGGAVHIKFSRNRDAINILYKHNPIHRDVENRQAKSEQPTPAKHSNRTQRDERIVERTQATE